MNVATPAASSGRLGKLVGRARQRAFRFAPADRAPVVLRHSRIYILPSRRGFAVIPTLMLMLLTSLNYALSLGLGVTFLLGGLVAAALLHTFRNLAGIEIKPLAASDAFAGSHVVFSLSLAAGAADRRASAISANGAATTASVAAGALATVTLAVAVPSRGRVALGREHPRRQPRQSRFGVELARQLRPFERDRTARCGAIE